MKRFWIVILRFLLSGAIIGILLLDIGITTLFMLNPPLPAYHFAAIWLVTLFILLTLPILWIIRSAWTMTEIVSHGSITFEHVLPPLRSIWKAACLELGICLLIGLPFSYVAAQLDDAPGLVILGLVGTGFVCVAMIVSGLIYYMVDSLSK